MKMFRRIFALTMVIAMVCLFSASAFAAVYSKNDYYDEVQVMTHAEVDQSSAMAELTLNSPDAVGNYINMSVECEYYPTSDLSYRYIDRPSGASTSNEYSCTLYYSPEDIYRMYEATYSFYAEFLTYNGMQYHYPPSLVLPY